MQPDGPNSEEIIKNNQALILETFRARLAEVTNAGMLDGIIVHAEMPYVLGVSIEGPEENIKALREFIKNKNIGALDENGDILFVPDTEPSA